MFKQLALAAALFATPVAGATFQPGTVWTGQLTGEHVLTFTAPHDVPCSDGDWSQCSYHGGGTILAVADPVGCSWCGTVIGNFDLTAYKPSESITLDFSQWVDDWIVVQFTGGKAVRFDGPAPVVSVAPAVVPLPATLPLVVGGILSLLAIRSRKKKV